MIQTELSEHSDTLEDQEQPAVPRQTRWFDPSLRNLTMLALTTAITTVRMEVALLELLPMPLNLPKKRISAANRPEQQIALAQFHGMKPLANDAPSSVSPVTVRLVPQCPSSEDAASGASAAAGLLLPHSSTLYIAGVPRR